MPKNRLQVLYNLLEKEFARCEETFLNAEKSRQELKEDYGAILATMNAATEKFTKHPQAAVLKRIGLIETLLKDLLLRHETERRYFNALGFLLGRLRTNLATEMLEPRLYQKIRSALEKEEHLTQLREKYPDAEAVITKSMPVSADGSSAGRGVRRAGGRKIRLMLIGAANLHYAIPVTKIWKKMPAVSPVASKLIENGFAETSLPVNGKAAAEYAHAVAYSDLKGVRRLVYCDEYFTPVEIPQKMLKQIVTYGTGKIDRAAQHRAADSLRAAVPEPALRQPWRAQVKFYGRHFFVYGARLSYTVRIGVRSKVNATHSPDR